jgi:hypothetical protein
MLQFKLTVADIAHWFKSLHFHTIHSKVAASTMTPDKYAIDITSDQIKSLNVYHSRNNKVSKKCKTVQWAKVYVVLHEQEPGFCTLQSTKSKTVKIPERFNTKILGVYTARQKAITIAEKYVNDSWDLNAEDGAHSVDKVDWFVEGWYRRENHNCMHDDRVRIQEFKLNK